MNRRLGKPVSGSVTEAERKDARRRTRYAIHLPFTLVEHIDWGGDDGLG